MNSHFKFSAAVFAAVSITACANMNSGQVSQSLEARIAMIEKAKAQEAEYFDGLAAAVRAEARNEGWAIKQESMLRESYTATESAPRGALQRIECRSSKCEVELQLTANQPARAMIDQQLAIDQWIAWSQPCSYAMAMGSDQASNAIRIFLDCAAKELQTADNDLVSR